MKAAENKTTTASLQKKAQPFFEKGGGQSFFSDRATDTSFFTKTQSKRPIIQPKLTIGQPDDKYEKEADAVADKVVQRLAMPDVLTKKETAIQTKPLAAVITPILQTKCAACEQEEKLQRKDEEDLVQESPLELQLKPIFESNAEPPDDENSIQRKCASCEQEEKLQRKEDADLVQESDMQVRRKPIFESNAEPPDDNSTIQRKCAECEKEEKLQKKQNSSDSPKVSSHIESSLNSSKGRGSSIPAATKEQMENSFGADFSHVRLHNDSSAVQMSKDLHAQAFTHGSDIYFNAGKYTNSTAGRHLLAHELTHVLQQQHIAQRKIIQKVPCVSGAVCTTNTASPGAFSASEEAAEAPARAAIAASPPASVTASGHGRRAVNIEAIVNFHQAGFAFPNTPSILGVFVDNALSEDTGAMTTDCSSFAATVPGLACGAHTHLIATHSEIETQAATYLSTTTRPSTVIPFGPASWGTSLIRGRWLTALLRTIRHERQHRVFDAAVDAGTVADVGTCTMATTLGSGGDVAFALSEITSLLSEFQVIEKAFRRGRLNATMHADELTDFRSMVTATDGESVIGAIKDIKCTCNCSDANQLLTNNFNFSTTGWARSDKTNLNQLLQTELGALWPVFTP